MDVANIPAGHKFDQAIQHHVENSKVVLAVIGRRWMESEAGLFSSLEDREALVDHLNELHGIAIQRARAGNAFVAFKLGNVDLSDMEKLLGVFDVEMGKRSPAR